VAQCYLRDVSASLSRPVRELKGFARLHLQPGEPRRVAFTLGRRELSYHNETGQPVLEAGRFAVWIGEDSCAALGGEFSLEF
jgi:beta-glucosidase